MNPMNGSRTRVVLARPEYSVAIYRASYSGQFKPGMKQVEPPMALMQIGAALVEAGHDVRIIDGEAENLTIDRLVERICDEHPDIVGVTSTTPEYCVAKRIIEKVKRKLPGALAVIGGAHATHVPWELADEIQGIDHVVVYEGEKAMVAIANQDTRSLAAYSDNAQRLLGRVGFEHPLRYRGRILLGPSQTTEDLERLRPLRCLPHIDMRYYKYADPQIGLTDTESVETARGCPFGCTFCSSANSGLGMRSVDNVLEELEIIDRRFRRSGGQGFVVFLDDTLTFSRRRATELFEGILHRGLRLHYKAFTRANTIATRHGHAADVEFARLMKRAGSVTISFGIETGSQRINQATSKGVTLDDYRNAYAILDKVDFEERRGSFIIGHPYETEQTIAESIAFAGELGLHRIGVNIMTPYPGTEVYNNARMGRGIYFEGGARDYAQYRRWGKGVISTETLTPQALEYWHNRFLTELYTAGHVLRHGAREFLRGNRSRFYHRPVTQAVRERLKLMARGAWRKPPRFGPPDHSGYDPEQWGRAHITKTVCIAVLREIYQVGPSRKPIQKVLTEDLARSPTPFISVADSFQRALAPRR
ncbi:MAG: radical SAM protein [Phycisphaerae bacterium]